MALKNMFLAVPFLLLGCPTAQGTSDAFVTADAGPSADARTPGSDAPEGEYIPSGFTRTPDLAAAGTHPFAAADDVLAANTDYAIVMETTAGRIVLDLHEVETPIAANSFVFLARNGFFDGIAFHRVIDGFMAQTGDPNTLLSNRREWGFGGAGYTYIDETAAGYSYDRAGIVGMANSGPDTNSSQFFITLAPATHLPAADYTIAAHVIEGLDVLPEIIVGEPAATPSRITRAYVVQRPR
jgi:peptidylprolyl isomerase